MLTADQVDQMPIDTMGKLAMYRAGHDGWKVKAKDTYGRIWDVAKIARRYEDGKPLPEGFVKAGLTDLYGQDPRTGRRKHLTFEDSLLHTAKF